MSFTSNKNNPTLRQIFENACLEIVDDIRRWNEDAY